MKAYINGMGIISPQKTWNNEAFLETPVDYDSNHLTCIEPDYTLWSTPQQLRRMSRILKMGTGAAMIAMRDAKLERPDAIITGTGYGCLEDTATFLTKITELKEEALNPTPFMQSTHNTIGSQIGLLLQCRGYNQTYTHGAFSFEQSLLDTLLHLAEDPQRNFLTGGVDEWTFTSYTIQSRFNKYRNDNIGTLSLLQHARKGTVAGEGAAYFVLSGESNINTKASVEAVHTFYQPHPPESTRSIHGFLQQNGLGADEIDLLVVGKSGDETSDRPFDKIISEFNNSSIGVFKHLCGEYCCASTFAMWMSTMILSGRQVPPSCLLVPSNRTIKTVLIYNIYAQHYHTLLLLKSCRDTVK
jgi:3-oxoacyl-[acyl-carrier-protein] synthase II